MQKITNNTEANSFYCIFSGIFTFENRSIDNQTLNKSFSQWQDRINSGNYKVTFDYLLNSYYDGYINNMLPEIRNTSKSKSLNHITLHKNLLHNIKEWNIAIGEHKLSIVLDFIDVYLFPNNMGIFSYKIHLKNENQLTIGNISDTLNRLRNLSMQIEINESLIKIEELIEKHILSKIQENITWRSFNPQLKTYTVIDLKEPVDQPEMDAILFDMGNVSPIGSARGETLFSPSETYYKEQMENNKISVFRNWSALALYDTFTRISINFEDKFNTWETDFFQIYAYCLYMKSFLYNTNTQLSNINILNKENEVIRNQFVEFVNDYNHTQISYKFLPDLLKDKIAFALDMQSEMDQMEIKIARINQHLGEKRQRNMNFILLLITSLSMFSLIKDIADFAIKSGSPAKQMYPWGTSIIGVIVIGLLLIVYRFKKK